MATSIQVLGQPGSGKTYSLRNLDPKSTLYINCDKKSMTFRGWKSKYNKENKNYVASSDANQIMSFIQAVNSSRPDIKCIVVDTISSIMSDKEMSERKKKNFDKWLDYAGEIYDLYSLANNESLRDDLFIIFLGHTETYQDNHVTKQRLLTGGNKLTKLNIEGKLSYTLYTDIDFEDGKPSYSFLTQSDGTNTARSSDGCFEYKIPNDLATAIQRIEEYEQETS